MKLGRSVCEDYALDYADHRIRSRRLWISSSSLRLSQSSSIVSKSGVCIVGGSYISCTDASPDKHVLSEDEKKTQEYDALAYRYVSYGAIPCLAGYTIYSLIYETHRGWYSFVITTLTSFVYMFGFVSKTSLWLWTPLILSPQAQLIPQLIINYKLKARGITIHRK